jgi:tRNA pseudouridine38-40 synthase
MPKYFLKLSYCGTHYNGWQAQANTDKTIQKIISDVLSVTLRHSVNLVGCGRTDTGVHASEFFAHFESETLSSHPYDFWIYKWNSMLPNDIAIDCILPVVDSAHARYSAISRTYHYFIHQKKDPFKYQHSWYYTHSLNHTLILQAIDILKQHNDFACFTKDAKEYENTLCNIYDAEWQTQQHQIIFSITANRFLRNMVRATVGTLIEIGLEKISLSDFENILHSKDRKNAGFSAPAVGLHLTKIIYPSEIFIHQ